MDLMQRNGEYKKIKNAVLQYDFCIIYGGFFIIFKIYYVIEILKRWSQNFAKV